MMQCHQCEILRVSFFLGTAVRQKSEVTRTSRSGTWPAKHALGINPRPGSTLVCGEITRCQAPKPAGTAAGIFQPQRELT